MKKTLFTLSFAMLITCFNAQEWVDMMLKQGKNFYEIQASFNNYWKGKDVSTPGNGYKPFKRWEHFVEQRVYPSGDLSLISTTWNNYEAFLKKSTGKNIGNGNMTASTTWTAIGPMGPMTGVATNGFPRKAGRDNFITFHPTQPSTFWAGAPAGGLWKTTNGGTSWTTNTDYLSVIGCSDLAIDPSNPNTMYLATGDGDAGDTYCIGVLKSTDGGLTWNTTGLTFPVSQQRQMRRIIVNPSNTQIVMAATDAGIYRSTNGGTSWTQINSNNTFDLEFKPGDPTTVYAGGTAFYLSTNSGASFTAIATGIPTGGINRMSVAVTVADPTYVYVLASNSSTSGFFGLYRSTSSGTSFTQMSSSPDVLANSCSGSSGGGQGWYDLCVAVSPLNKNVVAVGGVNVWTSNSGGATGSWTCTGCWIGTSAPSVYLKADHHDLDYNPSGTLYAATDGGIFSYNVTNWIDLNNQRNIAQIYKIGLSSISPNKWITGHQDNGSNIYTGATYTASRAGDGMDCFIDRTNDLNMFSSTPYGGYARSTTGGTSWNTITSGLSGSAAWVAPWKQDPTTASRLYAGWSQMFVSNNLGASWTQLTATGGSGTIVEFAIAPSNNQVIYVIHGSSIRKSSNGGSSWTNVTGTIPVGGAAPTFITISPTDPNRAWVTLSGYSAGNKVFQTINGGTSWTNVSSNLPNLPANCSVYQPGSGDRIYIGMDVGVYYKDNSTLNWTLYNQGLPNTPVSDMEISPASPGKLRAATYGRGVYEVDVIANAAAAPVSNFSFVGNICSGASKIFSDNSSNIPTSWNWSVSPSSGVVVSNASAQNPVITFPSSGVYTVSMVASNTVGTGGASTQTINVLASPVPTLSLSNTVICVNDDASILVTGANTYTWLPGFLTGSVLTLNTAATQNITYTCNALASNGCSGSQTLALTISECTGIKDGVEQTGTFLVFPNPANSVVTIQSQFQEQMQAEIKIYDIRGKLVLKQESVFRKDKSDLQINISGLANGVYSLRILSESGGEQVVKLVKE
ncbi:MAG: T9SS type A sorting domain-containing protein [Bacteroidia bacterium]|nr:T9SS type A sorting domain-containing protein [Bacteroidia bacterium]